jgi:MarR family
MHAGSERALIYNGESYEHRCVFVAEADSIPEDGPAASVVRSSADTNQASYDVVERDEQTSRFTTRHIEKPGPTSLMTTGIRSPRTQLGTRMFEVNIPDDESRTRAIMQELARRVSGKPLKTRDLGPFHALQRWIGFQDIQEPVIPFAEVLSERIPANQVRFRRDLPKIFTFIKTSALLHQCQRERDDEGRLICTLEDYATVLRLLSPTFDAVLADGVTPAIRATVSAVVNAGREVSQAELASTLKVSKQTASYRVTRALKDGWLVNNEQRKGHPAKLIRGTPLPEERAALPTVAKVMEESNCPMAFRAIEAPLPTATPACPECGRGDAGCSFDPDLTWLEVAGPRVGH